ncbi:unnamed protein product, partial [Mesorhabditis spiculigera]
MAALAPGATVLSSCIGCQAGTEYIHREIEGGIHLMTFIAFILVSAKGIIFEKRMIGARQHIPTREYMAMVVLFFIVNQANNYSLYFDVSMPLFIIFKSGSLLANLLLARVIRRQTHSWSKICAILRPAWSAQPPEWTRWLPFPAFWIGVLLMSTALVLSAYLGIMQEDLFRTYGRHHQEALFFVELDAMQSDMDSSHHQHTTAILQEMMAQVERDYEGPVAHEEFIRFEKEPRPDDSYDRVSDDSGLIKGLEPLDDSKVLLPDDPKHDFELIENSSKQSPNKALIEFSDEMNGPAEPIANDSAIPTKPEPKPMTTSMFIVDEPVPEIHFHDFELTSALKLFSLVDVRLVHGWLPDPQLTELCELLEPRSYVDAAIKALEASNHGLIIKEFLDSTKSQLTYYGLERLNHELQDNEVAVLFRNNHFSTIYKRRDELFLLCTDEAFGTDNQVVWETLSNVDGDCYFVDWDFRTYSSAPSDYVPVSDEHHITDQPGSSGQMDSDERLARALQEEEHRASRERSSAHRMAPERTLCKYFASGACTYGESHDFSATRSNICQYYVQGNCQYGTRCRYDHIKPKKEPRKDEAQGRKVAEASGSRKLPKPIQLCDFEKKASSSGLNVNAQEFVPSWVTSDQPKNYASAAGSRPSPQIRPLCPYFEENGECKKEDMCEFVHGDMCSYCNKNALHPFDNEQRYKHEMVLIDYYRENTGQKICRYYKGATRAGEGCPFGNKCWYRHQLPDGSIDPGEEPGSRVRPKLRHFLFPEDDEDVDDDSDSEYPFRISALDDNSLSIESLLRELMRR